ncbi:hypothetical protein [Maliponia aquimaris]|uniref:hypothetical protein n=1 Tax=Maliponia aquimaris TaxID=1673631 RepID=UPI001595210F
MFVGSVWLVPIPLSSAAISMVSVGPANRCLTFPDKGIAETDEHVHRRDRPGPQGHGTHGLDGAPPGVQEFDRPCLGAAACDAHPAAALDEKLADADDQDFACGRVLKAGTLPHRRGPVAAGRSQEDRERAVGDGQAMVLDADETAPALAEIAQPGIRRLPSPHRSCYLCKHPREGWTAVRQVGKCSPQAHPTGGLR